MYTALFLPLLASVATLTAGSARVVERNNDDHAPASTPQFEYLFTINYKFGGATPIIFSQGVVENGASNIPNIALTRPANTFVGASITGPALNGELDFGVITNRFVAYGTDTIVFEEATWFGSFYNGDQGNGTLIARTNGLVDYKLYEQQRVVSMA